MYSFGAAAENGPSNPGWSDDHLRTLKIVKLPLDHTDDDISINMGSGRKGGRSWRYNKYNRYRYSRCNKYKRYNRYNRYKRYRYNRYNKLNRYSPSILTNAPTRTGQTQPSGATSPAGPSSW